MDVWGIEPEKTKKILAQLKEVAELSITADNLPILKSEIERIEKQLEKLERILSGEDEDKDEDEDNEHKAFFPIIDEGVTEGFYGIIESVTVRINKAFESDKFIIVPSEKEIEKKILEQCKRSWFVALDLSRAYIKKPYKHHEVIISFDKREGFYEGNSLGTALTLSFLEQLLKFYNPVYVINIKKRSAFTGGVNESGRVLTTGEEIIKRKTSAIFFSDLNTFVFPKCEEAHARNAYVKLQEKYPDRKLKLIPVEDISDVLNRRDVVDIRKQKLIVRTGKFVKKNWMSTVATVVLAVLFAFLFVMDFDDNPVILENNGFTLVVKNKNGKTLWIKKIRGADVTTGIRRQHQKIVDVNRDEINEVLLCNELFNESAYPEDQGRIACFDFEGKLIWKYVFKDTVSSPHEKIPPIYEIKMIDTITVNNIQQIICIANNGPSYASAVFKLDIKNGKRLNGTLWNAGHIVEGILEDINNDSLKELVMTFYNNSYHKTGIAILEFNKIKGISPCKEEFKLTGMVTAGFIHYILVPSTDYNKNLKRTMNNPIEGILKKMEKEKAIVWSTIEGEDIATAGVVYELNLNLKEINLVIGSNFAVRRDTLVLKGILNYPLTDTKAYRELLKSQILYWNGVKFVTSKEIR